MPQRAVRPLCCALLASALAASAGALPSYEILPLGFTDAEHTRSDGYRESHGVYLTDSGRVLGRSERYAGAAFRGQSAWLYDANDASTTRLGYVDAMHTDVNGSQDSFVIEFSEAGYVTGASARYAGGSTLLGSSAWIYDANDGSTVRLGFSDASHTRSNGYQHSRAELLSESEYVAGFSARFDGLADAGRSGWLHDTRDASTTRLGYLDADHTRSDGFQSTSLLDLSEAGRVLGTSQRFGGAASLGQSAWIYDASDGSTTRIGYVDAEHTRNDGFQSSFAGPLGDSGNAVGHSARFSGALSLGQSAWLYDASDGSTTRLGLVDASHTQSDGFQYSRIDLGTDSGYVAGTSLFYGGTSQFLPQAQSVWYYDPSDGSTTRLGLLDAAHTGSEGYQSSQLRFLTESGYAAGYSRRVNGGDIDLGQTAWVYDPTDGGHEGIVLSVHSTGFAHSDVSFLGDDGLALGSYYAFGSDDTVLGYRAFAWTPDGGAVDLGALVVGGLEAADWAHLAEAIHANGLGQIIGSGGRLADGNLAYLLVPVPEPGTGLLLAAGLVALAARRRPHARTH